MKELVIGSKFYNKGKLVEVCVNKTGSCDGCVFSEEKCLRSNCKSKYRHDEINVIYKEVKE